MMRPFIEYVSRYQPSFGSTLRGASQSEIATLASTAQAVLPASYQEFLAVMGHGDGGLRLTFDGSTDISDVIRRYESFAKTGRAAAPPNCILIGLGTLAMEGLCMWLLRGREPSIVFTRDGRVTGLYAESLEKLLYRTAFLKFGIKQFPCATYLASLPPARISETATTIALESGFRTLWFSDPIAFCGEKPGAAIVVNQYDGEGASVVLRGTDQGALDTIAAALEHACDVRRQASR